MTFNEDDHIRNVGKFADKPQSAPESTVAKAIAGSITSEMLDSLSVSDLNDLQRDIRDRLGVVGPYEDREEARYRLLEDPESYEIDPAVVRSISEKFGGDEKFLVKFTETIAWGHLDEHDYGYSDRIHWAVEAALLELQNEEVVG